MMTPEITNKTAAIERVWRRILVAAAIIGLLAGIAARIAGLPAVAGYCWTLSTVAVVAGLAVSIVRDLAAGRLGVDAIALTIDSSAMASTPNLPAARSRTIETASPATTATVDNVQQ